MAYWCNSLIIPPGRPPHHRAAQRATRRDRRRRGPRTGSLNAEARIVMWLAWSARASALSVAPAPGKISARLTRPSHAASQTFHL